MKILIAGCGYVGRRLAEVLAAEGNAVECWSRSPGRLPPGCAHRSSDLTDAGEVHHAMPSDLDHVVYCAAPSTGSEEDYRATYVAGLGNVVDALERRGASPRVFFTSSTAVYAQVDGRVVDESSPTEPDHYSGRIQVEAERRLLGSSLPGCVVRCGGIYGPERTRLLEAVAGARATYSSTVEVFTNRIHRDDIAHGLRHLMALPRVDDRYVFVDSAPAPRREVLEWLAEQLGAPAPEASDGFDAGRRGSRSNKRCSNARLLATGYRLLYPTYRDGYAPLLAAFATA